VHCRSGSFLNLSLQSIILLKTLFLGLVAGFVRQLSRQLPCLNIFNAGKAGKRLLYGFPA
jgi:hypothetical protein